jgi:hypothetical protein
MTAVPVTSPTARVPAGGTVLRLRGLIAMGHWHSRIARALGCDFWIVRDLASGKAQTVQASIADAAAELYEAWWDKVPPERSKTELLAGEHARRTAMMHGWCCPAGIDDDLIDEPGYQPLSLWRRADGTGTADDDPLRTALWSA